jgi:WD40 repeat protein
LYLHLADVAQTRGPRSGGLTVAELRAELERRQVRLRSGQHHWLSPRAAIPQVSISGHIGRELIERPELIEQLLRVLLAKDASVRAKMVSAVRGVGGIGKTTLVGQVCTRTEVQANFTGGVLWITIGETAIGAELAQRANDLVERLTGARPSLSDPEQAGFQLGEAIDAQRGELLLVLDDVWTEEQLQPFLLGGRSCHRLITTRNRALLPGIPSVHVEKMTHEQATSLLTRGLGAIPSSVAGELVRLNFRWPVLLELTNRALHRAARQRADIVETARRIGARLRSAGPQSMDGPNISSGAERHTVTAAIGVSLSFLPSAWHQRYFELGIFAEDTEIPCTVLELLWGATGHMDGLEVEQLCEQLYDLSLVSEYRPDSRTIRLHDVLRAYVRGASKDEIPRWNQSLLDAAVRQLRLNDGTDAAAVPPWWNFKADQDYLLNHLAEHLLAAGRVAELGRLVTDLRWAACRIARRGPASIEADLALAGTPIADTLGRAIGQAAHLLAPLEPDFPIDAMLASRLDGVPGLQPIIDGYLAHLSGPRLVNRWPLPDSPPPGLRRAIACHQFGISAMAIAKDGSWVATAGTPPGETLLADTTVRIWDIASGTLRTTMTGHEGPVFAMALSPDGTKLATGSNDSTVRVWDIATGSEEVALRGHAGGVSAVTFSPDGTWLATGEYFGPVRTWDVATGKIMAILNCEPGESSCVVLAPDGTWLATATDAGRVQIWDPVTARIRLVFVGPWREVLSMCVAPNGSWLAGAGNSRTVWIWDLATGTARRIRTRDTRPVAAVASSPDSKWLITVSEAGTIRRWDAATSARHGRATSAGPHVSKIAVSPDGAWIVTGDIEDDPAVRMWGITEPAILTGHTYGAPEVAIAPDGTWLATGGAEGTVRIWDVATVTRKPSKMTRPRPLREYATGLAIDPGGLWIAIGTEDRKVRIMDLATAKQRAEFAGYSGGIAAIEASPDGTWVATHGSGETRLRILNVITGAEQTIQTGYTRTIAIAPDATWIATSNPNEQAVRLWDTASGVERAVLTGHQREVNAIAAAPDGTWLASGSGDGTVRTWDVRTGAELLILRGHQRGIDTVAIAPNGKWLAAGGVHTSVRIWNLALSKPRSRVAGHDGGVWALAISPNGEWLAALGSDDTIRIWDKDGRRLLTALRIDGAAYSCAWQPDSSGIAVAGSAGVYLFDLLL